MDIFENVRAGIYCRISDDRAGGGLGVERQRRDCVDLAARLGWTVVDTFTDNDISAYSGKRRPEYERLLADIGAGHITGLITWHPDRLNRSPLELERLIGILEQHSVPIQSVTAGLLDLKTPSGRVVARLFSNLARWESEHKGTRQRAKKLQMARAGEVSGGGPFRPYGYAEDRVTVVPEEAVIIRDLMRRVLAGESVSALTRSLNDRGHYTTGGLPWRTQHVMRMLCSARICGWRDEPWSGRDRPMAGTPFLAKAVWPGIVSRAQVEQARVLLNDDTTRPGSHRRWLLSGIAVCGLCGLSMTSGYADVPLRRYRCMGGSSLSAHRCGRVSVKWDIEPDVTVRIHDAVRGGLIRRIRLAGPEVFAPTLQALRAADQELFRLRHARDQSQIAYADWVLRPNQIYRTSGSDRPLAADIETIDFAAIGKSVAVFGRNWDASTMRQRRAIVRALTVDITVVPGGRNAHIYASERVHITWRA